MNHGKGGRDVKWNKSDDASLTLDLGCGSYCRGRVGIDIDLEWSHPLHDPTRFDKYSAPRNPHADLIIADANYPLPFRDNAFDKVFMIHVIEHLLRPYDCLCEVRRVLKPGGELILITPNARVSPADWRDEGHVYSFTIKTIERLVSKVFEIVECRILEEEPIVGHDIYVRAKKPDQEEGMGHHHNPRCMQI